MDVGEEEAIRVASSALSIAPSRPRRRRRRRRWSRSRWSIPRPPLTCLSPQVAARPPSAQPFLPARKRSINP